LHEEMRRRGEYMVGFAAWVHALERIKMGEWKNGVKRGLRGGGLLLFDGEWAGAIWFCERKERKKHCCCMHV
jgi:hypothetical protein